MVYDAALRYVAYRGWSIQQLLAFFGARNSTEVYDAWVRKKRLENITDEIDDGGKLHWIGARRHDRVLIYMHGTRTSGISFVREVHVDHMIRQCRRRLLFPSESDPAPRFPQKYSVRLGKGRKSNGYHLPSVLCVSIYRLASRKNSLQSFAPCILALTPFSPFPAQLRQINAAVKHLVSKGTSPSNIVLAGDSAGANLALQFLSHTLHPFPDAAAPPALSTPLAGVLLISPWVTFGQDYPSFKEYDTKDNINRVSVKFMADLATPGIPAGKEEWFEPTQTDEGWWQGLDGKVRRVMSTAGEVECLKDPIEEFSMTRLKPNVKDFTWLVEKNGVHIDFLCDFMVGEGGKSEAYKAVVSWLVDTFKKEGS